MLGCLPRTTIVVKRKSVLNIITAAERKQRGRKKNSRRCIFSIRPSMLGVDKWRWSYALPRRTASHKIRTVCITLFEVLFRDFALPQSTLGVCVCVCVWGFLFYLLSNDRVSTRHDGISQQRGKKLLQSRRRFSSLFAESIFTTKYIFRRHNQNGPKKKSICILVSAPILAKAIRTTAHTHTNADELCEEIWSRIRVTQRKTQGLGAPK